MKYMIIILSLILFSVLLANAAGPYNIKCNKCHDAELKTHMGASTWNDCYACHSTTGMSGHSLGYAAHGIGRHKLKDCTNCHVNYDGALVPNQEACIRCHANPLPGGHAWSSHSNCIMCHGANAVVEFHGGTMAAKIANWGEVKNVK